MATETHTSAVFGGQLITESGGTVELDPEEPMECPGTLQSTEYGLAFGPLEIAAYPGSTARVGGLTFLESQGLLGGLFDSEGSGLFGAALPIGAAHHAADEEDAEDTRATRRNVLKTGAMLGLLAGGATVVQAATMTKTRAQFAVLSNPEGIRIRVYDRVPDVLPTGTQYYTFLDGQQYATFSAANENDYGDVLPTATGTVTVGPKGSAGGFFSGLGTDKTQVYEGLQLSKSTTDADTGEKLTITDNDIIVEHVQSAGPGRTTLAINGTSVPHENESATSDRGYFGIHNGVLIYSTGPKPPSGQTADLVLYADRVQELLDDADRVVN